MQTEFFMQYADDPNVLLFLSDADDPNVFLHAFYDRELFSSCS